MSPVHDRPGLLAAWVATAPGRSPQTSNSTSDDEECMEPLDAKSTSEIGKPENDDAR